ncbi:hypothetical protein [Shewanella sp. MBTL60-007]|nr:hypothetical protein [Shewanella sp. MBTL60-007]
MDFIRHVPALFSMIMGIAIVECAVIVLGLCMDRLNDLFGNK